MTAPMTKRAINNQFRKAMKRRREREVAIAITAMCRLKHRTAEDVQLPDTAESFNGLYLRLYRRRYE